MDATTIIGSVNVVVLGAIWWDIRSMKERVEKISERHHQCQATLPKEYAAKDEVKDLWRRTDIHESDIAYLKGVRNGA